MNKEERQVSAASDPLDAYIDACAMLLGLPMTAPWKPGVRANLEVTLRLATLLSEFDLPDAAEPAPVFVA